MNMVNKWILRQKNSIQKMYIFQTCDKQGKLLTPYFAVLGKFWLLVLWIIESSFLQFRPVLLKKSENSPVRVMSMCSNIMFGLF
jgi:hypothetical protein